MQVFIPFGEVLEIVRAKAGEAITLANGEVSGGMEMCLQLCL